MAPRPSIILDFIARNASLLRAARENEQSLRRQRRALRSSGTAAAAAGTAFNSLAAGIAAASGATVLLLRHVTGVAREFDVISNSTDFSIQTLQRLESSGARVGVVFESLGDIVGTFTESLGDAQTQILQGERGTQVNALRLLGFDEQQILNAQRDVEGFFDEFYRRLRNRTAAQQQFIIGEFSLPDDARRLLALPDTPLRVAVDIPELSTAEVERLQAISGRLTQEGLRFTRELSRFVVENEQSIGNFLDAFREATPDILQGGRTLAQALVSVANTALAAFRRLEQFTGASGGEIAAGAGILFLFRERILNFISFILGALGRSALAAIIAAAPAIGGILLTGLSFLPVILIAALGTGLAALVDEVVFGGAIRNTITDAVSDLFDWINEQIEGVQDIEPPPVPVPQTQRDPNAFDQPSQTASFVRQPPEVDELTLRLRARIQEIEDEVAQLRSERDTDRAQGELANRLRELDRERALLELEATTRDQRRELQNLGDPAFVAEAHQQFIIGLQTQVAQLEQQIQSAGDPESLALQQRIQELQRRLSSLQEVPFNVAQFQSDRIIALRRQVAEAEALLNLQADPQYIEAQQRLRAIEIQNEGISLDTQLRDFSRFAAINRANETKRLQLAVLQAEDAANAVQARRALLLRQRQAEQALNNAQLRQQIDTFDDTAEGRRQERQLRDQLNLMRRAEDAQFRINNLSREYFETSIDALGQLLMGVTSLSDVIRSLVRNLLNRTVGANLELLSSQILSLGTNAGTSAGALDNSAGGPNLGAPKVVAAVEQQGQRQQMSQGQILAAGKMVVAAVNQQTRQQRVSQSLTLAAGKMVVAAVEQQNRLSQNGDLASARVIAAALQQRQQDIRFSQGEPLSIDMPATGDTYLEINVDARGGDEQSIQRGIDRATPELIRRVNESQIAGNATSPIQRDRIRRNIRVK